MALNYPKSQNPFPNDDDDLLFGGARGSNLPSNNRGAFATQDWADEDDEFGLPQTKEERLQKMKEKSMNRQLESTKRAMASIYDSEATGIATAEELLAQGEQLDNVERKTQAINQDLKVSQRHLTSIKSVFGGFKNWWSGNKNSDIPQQRDIPERESRLRSTLMSSDLKAQGPHPGSRVNNPDFGGFYEDDVDDSEFASMKHQQNSRNTSWEQSDSSAGRPRQQTQKVTSRSAYEKGLDDNLDLMSGGMARLKDLALGLGDEIAAQNEQVDRIMTQTDRADTKIRDQNRQMKGVLGVKEKK